MTWLEEPDVFCTLVPEHARKEGETVEQAVARLFEPVAKKDERNEVLPIEDPRFLEAVDVTLAKLIEHAPDAPGAFVNTEQKLPELIDRARGVFEVGGKRYHLRVTFLKRK